MGEITLVVEDDAGKGCPLKNNGDTRKSLAPIFTHVFQGCDGNRKAEYKAVSPSE